MNEERLLTRICINGEIDESALEKFISDTNEIIEAYKDYNEQSKFMKGRFMQSFPRITIDISSYGGCVHLGSSIIDRIQMMKDMGIHIDTHCYGMAYSMAFIIYLCGEKRTAGKFAKFMNHATSGGSQGYLQSQRVDLEFFEKLDSMFDDIILETTNMDRDRLERGRLKCDWIFAKEAIELGIINSHEDTELEEFEEEINEAFQFSIDSFMEATDFDLDDTVRLFLRGILEMIADEEVCSDETFNDCMETMYLAVQEYSKENENKEEDVVEDDEIDEYEKQTKELLARFEKQTKGLKEEGLLDEEISEDSTKE